MTKIKKIVQYVVPLLLILSILTICGCILSNKSNDQALPNNKYVAIEEIRRDHGDIIEGNYNYPREASPTNLFEYENASKYIIINKSLKAMYCFYHEHDTPEHMSIEPINVSGVYMYPYRFVSGAIIQDIDQNGTIYLMINNDSISLKIGERWLSPVTSTWIENASYANGTYRVKYTTKWSIENRGIFNKNI